MDAVTLGQAKASARKLVADQAAPGAVGQRIFGGRFGTLNTATQTTHQVTVEVEQDFVAVQAIIVNTNLRFSDQITSAKCSAPASAADLNNSSGTWVQMTKRNRNVQMTRPGFETTRPAFTVTEMIPLASVPRSDGGTKPLVAIRVLMAANGALPVYGNGTDSFTNWAARTDGLLWCARNQTGDQVATPSGFTSTTNVSQSPIVGVRFLTASGRIKNVMGVGDSITEGRGTYLNEGFILPACQALSSTALRLSYSNCGWNGQNQGHGPLGMFSERLLDLIDSPLRPDVLVYPAFSPNDEVTTITDAGIADQQRALSRVLAACKANRVVPVIWTGLPVNTAVNPWGASDAKRVAYNTAVQGLANRQVLVADTATVFSGTTSGGQVQINASYTADNIHPNDAGNTALTAALTPVLRRAVGL